MRKLLRLAATMLVILMAQGAALAAPFAYVPNEQQKLSVIDLATNTIVTRITTESATAGIAAGQAANRVYVTDSATRTLQVIDTTTNATIATLNVCAQPSVPALNPAGTRLVIPCRANDIAAGGVVVVDTATFFLTTAGQPIDARAAVWNSQGTRYFVTSRDRVSIFDGATDELLGMLPVSSIAFSLAVNAAGTRLYVATLRDPAVASSTPGITVFDLGTGATLGTTFTSSDPTWIALDPAGTFLYAALAQADEVQVFTTSDNRLFARITYPPGSSPTAVAVHPDGSRLYIQLAGTGQLDVRQAAPGFLPRIALLGYGASGSAFGGFIGAGSSATAPSAPGYLSGLWWNPSESGWGLQVIKRRNLIVATWFTYDDAGNQVWYISPGCAMGNPLSCSGPLYIVHGGKFFGGFDMSRARIEVAGSLQLQFTGVNMGVFGYNVAGQSRGVPIERQPVATSTTTPPVNFTDLWWNPSESGWGMTITHQPGNMFLAWYVYDSFTGEPAWLVSSCITSANACDGTLYRTTGPPFSQPFDSSRVHPTAVGSVHISFTDPDNGVLTYTVDGVDGRKNITREVF